MNQITGRTPIKGARPRRRSIGSAVVTHVTMAVFLTASVVEAQERRIGAPLSWTATSEFHTVPDGSERDGLLRQALRRGAELASQNPASAPVPAEHESWPVRHPVLLGALIGVPIGLTLQAGCGGDCFILTGATVGAGAYGGLIASAVHKARKRQPISPSMRAGLVAGTVASVLVASFIAGGSWSN